MPLYFWRSHGRGPQATKIGKELRYRAADVTAWLEERAATSPSPRQNKTGGSSS
jgi:predicted DNA-binding transcriptional regulator AlpA